LVAGGSASAVTFHLHDTDAGSTDILNTSGELVGGNSAVPASAAGISFTDNAFFQITPGELLVTYDVTSQGTSRIGVIGGGTAELYEKIGNMYVALPATLINLTAVTPGVIDNLTSFSQEVNLGVGDYEIVITSKGYDTIASEGKAKYSVELQGVAVPEPASWSLMLLGAATLGGALRRKRMVTAAA
jgi:hypothetical protein